MTNNGFDSFGGFDEFDEFDNNSFDDSDFSLDTGVQPPQMDSFNSSNNDNTQNSGFTDSFGDSQQNQFQDTPEDVGAVKKSATIAAVIGVIGIIIVIIIASLFTKKSNESNNYVSNDTVINNESTVENSSANTNVDDIMSTGNNNNSNVVEDNSGKLEDTKDESKVDTFDWSLITDSEDINFNKEYMECTFTVTNIEHVARTTDTNNNLVVVTRIQGSLSGLAGTYELYIPYNKGVKLVVGNRFTVFAQIGTYNNKTVVGEIKYY